VVSRAATETVVTLLDAEQRVDELAAMLAGSVSKATRQSAKELLDRAAAIKELQAASPQGRGGSSR
jgi:DNA repair ATPase RecN